MYNIVLNSWKKFQAEAPSDSNRPKARTQMFFKKIPYPNQFILIGGEAFEQFLEPPIIKSVTQHDARIYSANKKE